ncbi:unnamed protein product [Trifolium pratense]|uniref:Uncharacterized protein n=1 Tax=Trifolium pratense TaxID=57577 RepID=A0ACB0L839_TRIPR|nr:unnamed protein product [Trifolium pratense]
MEKSSVFLIKELNTFCFLDKRKNHYSMTHYYVSIGKQYHHDLKLFGPKLYIMLYKVI